MTAGTSCKSSDCGPLLAQLHSSKALYVYMRVLFTSVSKSRNLSIILASDWCCKTHACRSVTKWERKKSRVFRCSFVMLWKFSASLLSLRQRAIQEAKKQIVSSRLVQDCQNLPNYMKTCRVKTWIHNCKILPPWLLLITFWWLDGTYLFFHVRLR